MRIIRIAGEKAPPSSLYVVGDDSPCRQSEYGKWLAAHLGLPNPPEADASRSSGPRNIIRGRRLRNDTLKRELGDDGLLPVEPLNEPRLQRQRLLLIGRLQRLHRLCRSCRRGQEPLLRKTWARCCSLPHEALRFSTCAKTSRQHLARPMFSSVAVPKQWFSVEP